MERLILILIFAALACGTPYTVTPPPPATSTPVTTPQALAKSLPTVTAAWQVIHVNGCWNLRETPGGVVVGQACDRDLSVAITQDGGWYRSPLGWICGRAWGLDVTCKLAESH
jgi:hypothetical protein